MFTLKYRQNVKIVFVALALALMLFVEPVLAKKARSRSSKSSGDNKQSRQVEKASAAPKVRQPSNVAKTRTAVTSSLRSTKSRPRPAASKLPGRSNSARTVRPSVRQPRRVVSTRQSSKVTYSRRAGRVTPSPSFTRRAKITSNAPKPSRIIYSTTKSARSSLANRKSTWASSRLRKQVTVSTGSRISSDKTSRIAIQIGKKKPTVAVAGKRTRESELKVGTVRTVKSNSGKVLRKLKAIDKNPETRTRTSRIRKNVMLKVVDRISAGSRVKKAAPENRKTIRGTRVLKRTRDAIVNDGKAVTYSERSGSREHNRAVRRPLSHRRHRSPRIVRRIHRNEHVYWDWRNRICHRIVWPRYRFMVYYNWGPRFTFRYVYPYHHRRYVFVSLGGYWPIGYRHIRYYWYGCHPYDWYGYYPIAREVKGDTYNYYTYNYYYNDDGTAPAQYSQTEAANGIKPVDENTFADVREKLARQAAEEPDQQTPADTCFEDAVNAFEAADYSSAADSFAEAMALQSDDIVLPFACSQALFADEKYSEAVEVLRTALAKVSPEKQGVFYPRGLYADDDILLEQIDRLSERADLYPFDADMQLLLGYQLLGIGEIEKAAEPLQQAGLDPANNNSATILLNLLEKIRTENTDDTNQ